MRCDGDSKTHRNKFLRFGLTDISEVSHRLYPMELGLSLWGGYLIRRYLMAEAIVNSVGWNGQVSLSTRSKSGLREALRCICQRLEKWKKGY